METLRKKFVKDLRTLSQNLYKLSINIPESIIKFIYLNTLFWSFTSSFINNMSPFYENYYKRKTFKSKGFNLYNQSRNLVF